MNTGGKSKAAWMHRFKAAGIHFACSLVVLSTASFFIFFLWFPHPYWKLAGGQKLIEIILTVDLVLGPVLTLLLYDIKKTRRALALDMGLVITLQTIALSYGLHSSFVARPVYLVYEIDRFVVVTAADIDKQDLNKADNQFQRTPLFGIKKISVREPQSPEERLASFELALAGKDLSLRPPFWKPFDGASKLQLTKRKRSLVDLRIRGEEEKKIIDNFVNKHQHKIENLYYIPIIFRDRSWSAILEGSEFDIVGYLPIDGF